MAYNPALGDAISRVRFAVGDVTDPSIMPGGELTYDALLAANGRNEVATANAARLGLYAYYATQPTSISSNGESISWADRLKFWLNPIGDPILGTAGTTLTLVPVTYRDLSANTDEYSR